jgi:hypothetical protein
MIPAPRARVRSLIASHIAHRGDVGAVGEIVLTEPQREAVRRARSALLRFRGVLLADDVGTGKTYIALALIAPYANPLVIAPAALRRMWEHAARRAGASFAFISVESLAGRRAPPAAHDVVLIDEAHHLRNPRTRRYAVAVTIVRHAHTILLSATPVHNTAGELDAQLALFMGADARDLDDEMRARVVVRANEEARGPKVMVHRPFPVPDADHIIEAIQSLPAPVVPRDGGEAPSLVRMSFLRAWCSSREAMFSMLRRALRRAEALRDALRDGRRLSKRDLRSWIGTGEDQLAFTELLAGDGGETVDDQSAQRYVDSLKSLWMPLLSLEWIDDARAAHICTVVNAHVGVPILACSQYMATVDAMWARLRHMPRVAVVSSRWARIASGPVSRDEVLRRFAPNALGERMPHPRERIDLLVATDLVSEGLNLQDAGVLIHLDLPWTAARLTQRVGRIARTGSPHDTVHTYALSPPRAAEVLLALEQRLATKRRIAAELVGGSRRTGTLLGANGRREPAAGPELLGRIVTMLRPWADPEIPAGEPCACAVEAPQRGWLALIVDDDGARFVARIGKASATTNPSTVARAVSWLVSNEEHWLPVSWTAVREEAGRWIERQRGRQIAGVSRKHAARVQSRELASAMSAMVRSLPHERARVAAAAAQVQPVDPRRTNTAMTVALVVFCRRDETRRTHCSALRP